MPSNLMTRAFIAATYAPTASPTFTGTVGLPSGTAITSAALTSPVITAPSGSGFNVSETIVFTEDATSVTHTGTVVIPAGATLKDIAIMSTALWTDTSSAMIVGDADDPDGWFVSLDLSGTDLLLGESLRSSDATTGWGGKNGAYLVAATGRSGQDTSTKSGPYNKTAGSVIAVVSVTTPSGTAGRTYMTVTYTVGTARAATVA